jgi:hypothetical protein
MISENFIYIAALLNLVGAAIYIAATLKGKTRPNRVSWFMWALSPMVAVTAMVSQGVGVSALTTFTSGFGPLLILIASFVNKKSYWKATRFDIACGALSLLGLILWLITRTGNIAIFFSITADALAAMPTIVKTYKDPDSENYTTFGLSAISAIITLLIIPVWTFEYYAFPLYLLIVCLTIVGIGKYRLYALRKTP